MSTSLQNNYLYQYFTLHLRYSEVANHLSFLKIAIHGFPDTLL